MLPKIILTLFATLLTSQAQTPLGLKLPTTNDNIFGDKPEKFYMYTTRNFEGVSSLPWTAGQYGYVRDLRRTESEGVIATRFHEGIDIRPMKRDSADRPLDIINSIADGTVVHASDVPGRSNYGNYIVIEHDWGSGPFYSLYAHLDKITCEIGQKVHAGMPIAVMGYTGAGINRERSHLHLELNVMTNTRYPAWHKIHFTAPNQHGAYNGLNMNGLNIAELFIRHNSNPNLDITAFIAKVPTYFKVTVPRKNDLDIATRHPWIRKGNHHEQSPAWEISFSSSGFPLAVTPSNRAVIHPTITYVKPTKSNHSYHTKGILTGTGSQASLTSVGSRVIQLISGDFPDPEPIPAAN